MTPTPRQLSRVYAVMLGVTMLAIAISGFVSVLALVTGYIAILQSNWPGLVRSMAAVGLPVGQAAVAFYADKQYWGGRIPLAFALLVTAGPLTTTLAPLALAA